MNKRHLIFIVLASAIIAALSTTLNSSSETETTTNDVQETVANTVKSTETTLDTQTEVTEADAEQNDQSTPETTTIERSDKNATTQSSQVNILVPVIYTGYGHNESKPLPNGQATSTSCTTTSDIACTITYTNDETKEVITKSVTTNSQGVGIFEWVGGTDITTGTWSVQATAGDKTSEKEIIYVQ